MNEKFTSEQCAELTDEKKIEGINAKACTATAINVEELNYAAWFTIARHGYGDYAIVLFYDNEYNSGDDGEDL